MSMNTTFSAMQVWVTILEHIIALHKDGAIRDYNPKAVGVAAAHQGVTRHRNGEDQFIRFHRGSVVPSFMVLDGDDAINEALIALDNPYIVYDSQSLWFTIKLSHLGTLYKG